MADDQTKQPVKTEPTASAATASFWAPIENLRQEVERVFDRFGAGFRASRSDRPVHSLELSWPPKMSWGLSPAVDVVEKDKAYQITAELPGLNDTDVDVSVSNGMLTIKGEKNEEKEEKEKDYYLSERRYGAFQRSFSIPDGVDADKIEATFKKGLLTVILPKSAEAQSSKKKITVRSS